MARHRSYHLLLLLLLPLPLPRAPGAAEVWRLQQQAACPAASCATAGALQQLTQSPMMTMMAAPNIIQQELAQLRRLMLDVSGNLQAADAAVAAAVAAQHGATCGCTTCRESAGNGHSNAAAAATAATMPPLNRGR
jgi:hypothetical protein